MRDVYLYLDENRMNKVLSIDGECDLFLATLTKAKGLPPGKLFDLLLDGIFDLDTDGKSYSVRSESCDWQKSVSPLKAVAYEEVTVLQAFFGKQGRLQDAAL
jgi:hypothetical protein